MVKFGPGGNSESFYEQGYKSSVEMPAWLKNMGLDAYEYQCNKGVKIGRKTAEELGRNAAMNNIFLSIHAPYYINMASQEEEKRNNSIRYIMETLEAARWMGAKRIVAHIGSYSKVDKKWALGMSISVLESALKEASKNGYDDIAICPEVLGKMNQLGTLEEILKICSIDESLIPAVDFGHLYARSLGALNTLEGFEKILESIEDALGYDRLKHLHIHFSRIEFGQSGEKRHRKYDETEYGPDFELLAEAMYKKSMEAVVICESRELMAEDALKMKKVYERFARS